MRHAFDPDGGDGGAFDGTEQHATESGSDGGPESAFERLRGEHTVALSKRFGVSDQPLGLLESFKHSSFPWGSLPNTCYFEYNSTINCSLS